MKYIKYFENDINQIQCKVNKNYFIIKGVAWNINRRMYDNTLIFCKVIKNNPGSDYLYFKHIGIFNTYYNTFKISIPHSIKKLKNIVNNTFEIIFQTDDYNELLKYNDVDLFIDTKKYNL